MTRKEYADFLLKTDHDYNYYLNKYPKRELKEGQMVTRFAPSPTGFVHMGSLYTSFSDLQFAKQTNGICYLRIEDTDGKRTVENGVQGIIDDFNSLGISFDEDPIKKGKYAPYIQSEREDIYKAFAKKLIEEDKAYPCFCTEDDLNRIRELQEKTKDRLGYYGHYAKCRNLTMEEVIEKINNGQKYIIRLKSNGSFLNKIILDDLIKGKIEMPENDMDVVIIKGDGLPTYHFAHAVDDHLMGTTHVLRGDEWVASYPIHDQLFKMLDFPLPKFCHIAPITVREGDTIRKLSKRKDKGAAISYYAKEGIPTDVIRLYLATVNNSNFEEWYNENPDKTVDDFTFTFDKMPVGGSLFDIEKLTNISKIYFSRKKSEDILTELLEYLKTYDKEFYEIVNNNKDKMLKSLDIEKYTSRPRKDISSYSDVRKYFWYMFNELFTKDSYKDVIKKSFYNKNMLTDYITNVYNEEDDSSTWFNKIKEFVPKYNFASEVKEYKKNPDSYVGHVGDFCEMLRVAVTTLSNTPNLYDILTILGKEEIEKRVKMFESLI